MKFVKINYCVTCKTFYNEPKNTHCKTKGCGREAQAVIEINKTLFESRVAGALEGLKRDIYGTVRKASRQATAQKIEVEEPKKILTGAITD